jgi:hypothetical protein
VANGHGGQRTPSNPAPVSGPGAMSQRTDSPAVGGQPQMIASGGAYGDRTEMQSIQGGAEMAQAAPLPRPPGLLDPTARPEEPITAGAELGPGMGPQAAGIKSDFDITNDKLRPLVHSLELIANLPQSNPETRAYVRALKARLADGGAA